ncbi:MAG: hypothetical protein AB8B84_16495 [Granulosicoccus sp.]
MDPESVDKRAKGDQRARIDELGDIGIIANAGVFSTSPVPRKAVELEVTVFKKRRKLSNN